MDYNPCKSQRGDAYQTSSWVSQIRLIKWQMNTGYSSQLWFVVLSMYFLFPCRRSLWGTSGTTSTWAGRTTGCPTSPVASSGSSRKSTANRAPFQTRDPSSSTAGTNRRSAGHYWYVIRTHTHTHTANSNNTSFCHFWPFSLIECEHLQLKNKMFAFADCVSLPLGCATIKV